MYKGSSSLVEVDVAGAAVSGFLVPDCTLHTGSLV